MTRRLGSRSSPATRLAIVAAAATPIALALCAPALAAGGRAQQAVAAGARGAAAGDPGTTNVLNVATDLGAVIVLGVGLAMVGLALAIVPGVWRSRRRAGRPRPVASAPRA